MKKKFFDESRLRELIEVQTLPQWKVGEMLGATSDTIRRACREFGIQTQRTGPRSGDRHPEWKGGVRRSGGYVYIYRPRHPNATKQNTVLLHRLVMEKHIGRYLERNEVVHHVDGDLSNNQIENLELFSKNSEHLRKSLKGKCPQWSEEGKERIRAGVNKRAIQLRSGIGVAQRNPHTGRFEATHDKPSREPSE